MKKKIENEITEQVGKQKLIKVKFTNTYLGKLGNYYRDKVYDIHPELYSLLKIDCEKVE